MKIQRKIWNYILIFVLGMMGMITIIFFLVEKLLGVGRCFITQSAIIIINIGNLMEFIDSNF